MNMLFKEKSFGKKQIIIFLSFFLMLTNVNQVWANANEA